MSNFYSYFSLLFFCSLFFLIKTHAQNAYITCGGNGINEGVSVINTNTNTVIATIPTPYNYPDAVVVSPDGSKAFITYYLNNNHVISVINTSSNSIINNIFLGQGGYGSDGIDISPDGNTLYYVGLSDTNDTVYVVNTSSGNTTAKIILPTAGSEGIAVSPDGSKVYVASGNLIPIINTMTNTIISTISLGSSTAIYGIAVSPDGTKLYAADYNNHAVIVISTSTNVVLTSIPTGIGSGSFPFGIAISPDGSQVYASNFSLNNVAVINTSTNTLVSTIPSGNRPYGLALTLDGSKLLVANQNSRTVTVINILDTSVQDTVPVISSAVAFGKFIGGPQINQTIGNYIVTPSEAPIITGAFFNSLQNANGQLCAGINPGSNNLDSTIWGARLYEGPDIQNTYGWFGNDTKQYGAFLNRNIFITPANQPTSSNSVRIYFSNSDIQNFISSFNIQYGASKTIDDIRIIKYDGANVDLDRNNNDEKSSAYTSIIPSVVGNYGFTNDSRFFEFQVSSYSEFWIALTSENAPLPLHLISFNAENLGKKSKLRWGTASGQNKSHFDIERSNDGEIFSKINTVVAAVNSSKFLSAKNG